MLEIIKLTHDFPHKKMIDLKLAKGGGLFIHGKTGSGKTDLLNIIAGFTKPSKGSIKINGTDICSLRKMELDNFRRKNIGFALKQRHFIPSLSIMENLMLAQYLSGHPVERVKVLRHLDRLSMKARKNAPVSSLSNIEATLLNMTRAAINHPSILLVDDPASGIDFKDFRKIFDLLDTLREAKTTVVMTGHDNRLEKYFDDVLNLDE